MLGEPLAKEILRLIGNGWLNMGNWIGQGYDKASNMSGQRIDLGTKRQYPKPQYKNAPQNRNIKISGILYIHVGVLSAALWLDAHRIGPVHIIR